MARFSRYIGIDYSGAETPTSRLSGLRAFMAVMDGEPAEQNTTTGDGTVAKHMRWNWTRKELSFWLLEQLKSPMPTVVGIDHGFSFPEAYFQRYGLKTWDGFLDDFCKHWPTQEDHVYIDDIRESGPARTGKINEFRLTDRQAKGTQSVFKFDGQGTVGKSSHAGIPWLHLLRRQRELSGRLHFWPFDGFEVPAGRSVVAEVWPTLFRRMYPCVDGRTKDQHDAFCVAKWLQEADSHGTIGRYLAPAVPAGSSATISREGWILGLAS